MRLSIEQIGLGRLAAKPAQLVDRVETPADGDKKGDKKEKAPKAEKGEAGATGKKKKREKAAAASA